MLTEIEHAAGWWTSQLMKGTNAPTSTMCEAFKQALCVELSARYQGHWFPEDSQRGCAYRCIAYDHRIDSTLVRAAQTVKLSGLEQLLIHARWHTMFVNPGLVKVQNTKALAAPPTIVYTNGETTTTTSDAEKPQSTPSALKSCVAVPARRSSLQPNMSRTVQFTSPITSPLTPLVETIPSAPLTPSAALACPAPVAPKRSALKGSGHHRSQSTSPLANPLSVRFMSGAVAQLNSDAATFIPKSTSPPPTHPRAQSPPKSTTPPPATVTSLSASLLPPAAIGTTTSSSTSTSTSPPRAVSPTSVKPAVHHSSRSVDLNSALFASLSLTVTPAAAAPPAAVTAPKAVSPSSTATTALLPPKATSPKSLQSAVHHSSRSVDLNSTLFASLSLQNKPSSPPRGAALPLDAPISSGVTDDRLAPLPTVFQHMTRHKSSHSMFSFPELSTSFSSSSTPSQLSPSEISPTSSLSLPRLVSHHRGLSASLLPTAALYASEVASLRHTLPPQQLVR